jgi:hypothetical protein
VSTISGTVQFTGTGAINMAPQQGVVQKEGAQNLMKTYPLTWAKGAEWWRGGDMAKGGEGSSDGGDGLTTMSEEAEAGLDLFSQAHEAQLAKQQAIAAADALRLAHAAVARAFASALRLSIEIPSELLPLDIPYQPCTDDPANALRGGLLAFVVGVCVFCQALSVLCVFRSHYFPSCYFYWCYYLASTGVLLSADLGTWV